MLRPDSFPARNVSSPHERSERPGARRLRCPQANLTLRYSAHICKRLWSPGVDSEESTSPDYVVWRAGTTNRVAVPAPPPARLVSIPGLHKRFTNTVSVFRYTGCPINPNALIKACISFFFFFLLTNCISYLILFTVFLYTELKATTYFTFKTNFFSLNKLK